MVARLLFVLLSIPLLTTGAWAMPRGTVIIRGLRKELHSVEWEVKGKQVKVKTSRGVRWFELSEVELIPDVDSVDQDAPPALTAAQHNKLQRRLTLVPPPGWKPVAFKQPLLAEAYKHPTLDAYFELWISPAGDYPFSKEAGRVKNAAVKTAASKAMLLRYARADRPTFSWVELAGKMLLFGKGNVEAFGAEGGHSLVEYRLRHAGLEFAIAVRTPAKGKLTDPSPEELLGYFSFLPPVTEAPERYVDHELGFYLLSPPGPWSLLARPFDRGEPVRATRGSGEAVLGVEVLKSGTPQGIADEIVSNHKKQASGFLEVKTVERSTRDGQEVVYYELNDYPEGRRVLHAFMGLVLRTPGGKLLHFRGMADISDRAPSKQLKLMLDGVRFLGGDASALDRDLEAAEAAAEAQVSMKAKDYDGAISALDRCLGVFPDYVPAILFRAEAKKASGNFAGYREDLALAQHYDPSVQGATGPEAYVEEAKAAEKARDYAQACRSWGTAYEKSRDAKHLKSFASALSSYWTSLKREKADTMDRMVRAIEDVSSDFKREDEVRKVLASVYTGASNEYKKEKNFSKAFRYASKLKGLKGEYRAKADALRAQIKTAKEREKKQR